MEGLAPTKGNEQLVQFKKASIREERSIEKLFHKSVTLDTLIINIFVKNIIPYGFAVNMKWEVEALAPTKGKERLIQFRKTSNCTSNREDKSREKLFHKNVALDSRYDLILTCLKYNTLRFCSEHESDCNDRSSMAKRPIVARILNKASNVRYVLHHVYILVDTEI